MNSAIHSTDKISLLFLHGMFGAPDNWQSAMDHFGAQFEVHAPSLPVLFAPRDRDPVEFILRAVRQYVLESSISRAVVIGNSLGGHVAVRFAQLETGRCAGLVLSGSSGLFERGLERNVPRRPSREWLRNKIAEVFFDPNLVTESMIDEVAEVVRDRRTALQLVRVAQSAKRDSLAAVLPSLQVPTLLMWGENDRITPLATAWQFYELLPNSELRTIPQCGHAPMLERPHLFNELLHDFLSRCARPSNATRLDRDHAANQAMIPLPLCR